MSSILYYSSYCQNCTKLIKILSKSQIKEDLHFINIDKRKRGGDNAIYVILEKGEEVLLPPQITKVPALLLLNHGNHVLFGEQIYQHLQPKENSFSQKATNNNGEPMAFALAGGVMGVSSDAYSYLDQSADDLSAKGNGGMRQLHHYALLNTDQRIEAPPEDYVPDKISTQGVSLEQMQQQRNEDFQQINRQ